MRRRVVSVALMAVLACAARAEARGFLAGNQPSLASDHDRAALVPGAHREQRLSRPPDGRAPKSPRGWLPPFLPPRADAASPSLFVLGIALPAPWAALADTSGAARTSRGPPLPAAVVP